MLNRAVLIGNIQDRGKNPVVWQAGGHTCRTPVGTSREGMADADKASAKGWEGCDPEAFHLDRILLFQQKKLVAFPCPTCVCLGLTVFLGKMTVMVSSRWKNQGRFGASFLPNCIPQGLLVICVAIRENRHSEFVLPVLVSFLPLLKQCSSNISIG